MKTLEGFKDYIRRAEHLGNAARILHWDMETVMPKNGAENHIASLTHLSEMVFNLLTSDEMGAYVDTLSDQKVFDTLDDVHKKMVVELKREYEQDKRVPVEIEKRMTEVRARSQHTWEMAKYEDDFERMVPYFEEMITLLKDRCGYTHPGQDAYDVLVDNYERGMTKAKVTEVFDELRRGVVPLIEAIGHRPRMNDVSFKGEFDQATQRKFAYYLLEQIGYDLNSGCLMESVHPFTLGSAPKDVRITTSYDLEDIRSSAFSVLHEGGHGLYEQHINEMLVGTTLNQGTSMGIHESQSRFYENIIGRNRVFWSKHYGKVQELFKPFRTITLDKFYKGINIVEPSLIRVEADELTYNLHIIIRFELEAALFDGSLSVRDLPIAWHDKMKKYLGVVPQKHSEGVLQDVHWPGGMFGYFPSYALGNIYSGQFLGQMEKELGNIDQLLEANRLPEISKWLETRIHTYGKLKTPEELVKDVCGTTLNAKPIIQYYTDKYSRIYQL